MDTTYKGILTAAVLIALLGGVYYFSARTSPDITKSGSDADINAIVQNNSTTNSMDNSTNPTVILQTNFGDIKLELLANDAPKTVENFLKLAQTGFYDGVKFHRIIPNFMIQGGDPNSKDDDWTNDGIGGPGYKFKDELDPNTVSAKRGYVRGTLAMANAGPNTNGSQFFIMHQDYALPHLYTIFGKVLSGIEVVDKIVSLPKNQNDHPTTDAIVKKVELK